MKIISYWEGEKPEFISMCQETLFKYCPEATVFVGCNDHIELPINLKVDYFKAKKIYEEGGFWIDADMIVMKNLQSIFDLLDNREYVGIPGFFGARKGAPILKRWLDAMDERIKQGNLTFSDLIQPLLHDSEFKEFEPLTRDMICPIYHDEFNKFFQEGRLEGDPFIVTLYNSQFPHSFKRMTRDEILGKNWVIGHCFRKALD